MNRTSPLAHVFHSIIFFITRVSLEMAFFLYALLPFSTQNALFNSLENQSFSPHKKTNSDGNHTQDLRKAVGTKKRNKKYEEEKKLRKEETTSTILIIEVI